MTIQLIKDANCRSFIANIKDVFLTFEVALISKRDKSLIMINKSINTCDKKADLPIDYCTYTRALSSRKIERSFFPLLPDRHKRTHGPRPACYEYCYYLFYYHNCDLPSMLDLELLKAPPRSTMLKLEKIIITWPAS